MEKLLRLGFTGTQEGMTARQKAELKHHLERWLETYTHLEIHHGDCIGADSEFHLICTTFWPQNKVRVVLHPPTKNDKRAFSTFAKQIELPAKPYLERNRDIVKSVDGMIGAPKTSEEELRSGTWATIRYSRKIERPLILLKPR